MSIDLNRAKTPKKVAQKATKGDGNSFWVFMNRDINLGSGFGAKKKVAFYEELEVLLSAGLDIQSALELIVSNLRKKKDKAVIEAVQEQILAGSTLSDAMKQAGKFSLYETFSIQIGEEAGKLNEVLRELSSFFQKTMKYRRQLMGALSYPIFVLSFSMLAVWFLLTYLVPMFSGIYARFGNELPYLTRLVVNLSDGMQVYAPWIFLLVLGIAAGFYSQRKQPWLRRFTAELLLRMPIFGGIVHRLYLARFCQSMGLLLSAKVPLLQATELVQQMIRFFPIEKALESTQKDIMQGQSLYHALQQFGFFPPQFLALIKVGEESGRLDLMFERLANQYNTEVDQRTQVIGSLIEPVLIIFLGVIVAVILIAMYLPLFQMSGNMGL